MIYKIDVQSSNYFYKISVFKRNGVNAYVGAYSVNFLDDSKLLDLGFAFNHCLLLGTCALIKNNMLSIFMLSGSIQFSIPFQFNTNHAFIKIIHLYNVYYNVKDTYTNTLFNIIFRFSVAISRMTIKLTFTVDSCGESCPVCHSIAM